MPPHLGKAAVVIACRRFQSIGFLTQFFQIIGKVGHRQKRQEHLLVIVSHIPLPLVQCVLLFLRALRNIGSKVQIVHTFPIETHLVGIYLHPIICQGFVGVLGFNGHEIHGKDDIGDLLQKSGDQLIVDALREIGHGHTFCHPVVNVDVVTLELNNIGGNKVPKIFAQLGAAVEVKFKAGLLSHSEKVVENSQALRIVHTPYSAAQLRKDVD